MDMKKEFERTFKGTAPEAYYIAGDFTTIFVISKDKGCEYFSLYVVDCTVHHRTILKMDTFENLIDIVNMLTYPLTNTIYYERCPKEYSPAADEKGR